MRSVRWQMSHLTAFTSHDNLPDTLFRFNSGSEVSLSQIRVKNPEDPCTLCTRLNPSAAGNLKKRVKSAVKSKLLIRKKWLEVANNTSGCLYFPRPLPGTQFRLSRPVSLGQYFKSALTGGKKWRRSYQINMLTIALLNLLQRNMPAIECAMY